MPSQFRINDQFSDSISNTNLVQDNNDLIDQLVTDFSQKVIKENIGNDYVAGARYSNTSRANERNVSESIRQQLSSFR
jgi:hypothetical protein